ncbi:MAG: phospholipase D-like domain-containing protein [Pseudomonas sp.]|uniref:phospholipase D-like domain-containing protein n=1 Tax=Pseudomonas sp. TaxID=306 RepID=UPI003D6E9EEA
MSEIASFRAKLKNLVILLDDPEVTEIAINGPGNVWAGYRGQRLMKPVPIEGVTVPLTTSLGEVIAAHTGQQVDSNAIHHDKLMVVDGMTVETGSFNFTAAAAKSNSENALVVWNDPALAETYLNHWQSRWYQGIAFKAKY